MDYIRYLRSKQTVDDRALNLRVLQDFESFVSHHATQTGSQLLRVVEVGGGIGAMFMRLLRRKHMFVGHARVEYTIVDVKQEVLLAALEIILREAPVVLKPDAVRPGSPNSVPTQGSRAFHPDVSSATGAHYAGSTVSSSSELCAIDLAGGLTVRLVVGDAVAFLEESNEKFDVLIGAAVLDLWELESTLKLFFASLDKTRGLAAFYFPINFDGTTDFFPESSEGLGFDRQVEVAFHNAMGRRTVLGREVLACHTGRLLIPCLHRLNVNVKSMGGSTWIVSPDSQGKYPEDEAYFANCIIDFIQSTGHRFEGKVFREDSLALSRYIASRRKQITEGVLFYVAHNVDVFGVL